MKPVVLQECCQQDKLAIDEQENILRGVRLLGSKSKNNRVYTNAALQEAVGLYNAKPVNIDHPERSPTASRSLRDRFGVVKNPRIEGDCVRGDIHYNPAHPLAPSVLYFAKRMPEALGVSHNATGTGKTDGQGTFIVERVVGVRALDLVADPATNATLFEASMNDDLPPVDTAPELDPASDDYKEQVGNLVASIMKDDSLDSAAKLAKIKLLLKLEDAGGGESPKGGDGEKEEEDEKDAEEAIKAGLKSSDPKVRFLAESARKERQHKAQLVKAKAAIAKAKLPPAVPITEQFVAAVARCETEQEMLSLCEDRKATVEQVSRKKPVSGGAAPLNIDAKTFAQAVNGRK